MKNKTMLVLVCLIILVSFGLAKTPDGTWIENVEVFVDGNKIATSNAKGFFAGKIMPQNKKSIKIRYKKQATFFLKNK